MHWTFWVLIYVPAFFIGIYLLGFIILALFAKFEKDEEGNLKLDAQSWHFKAAFPLIRYRGLFWRSPELNSLNSCGYRRRFSHGFFMIWPFIGLFIGLGFLIFTLIGFLLRRFPIFNMRDFATHRETYEFGEAPPGFSFHKIRWLTFRGIKIYPIFVIALVLGIWNFSSISNAVTSDIAFGLYASVGRALLWIGYVIGCIVLVIAVVVGIFLLFGKINSMSRKKEEEKKVSVLWVSIKSWYDKVCYPLKPYNIPEQQD